MNQVVKYFNGEKAESYIFIFIGVIAFAMALYFIFTLKTSFRKGVAIPFILVALLEFIVGYTIVTRSSKDIIRVQTYITNESQKIQIDFKTRFDAGKGFLSVHDVKYDVLRIRHLKDYDLLEKLQRSFTENGIRFFAPAAEGRSAGRTAFLSRSAGRRCDPGTRATRAAA